MKRRNFIRNMAYGSAAGLTLGGIPLNLLAANSGLKQMAAGSTNDKVLVFIQLHGGNDGLNTLIPISQYGDYYNLRPNIAIKHTGTRSYIEVDDTVEENARVGLHPDMLSFKEMYDEDKVAIIQNVGYPDMNLSHFRGRDVVFMGGDESGDNDYNSGWMGRYLDNIYPGYPDSYPSESMLDPIGIELSGTLSLAFHRENGIPIGLNIGSPEQFYQLISSVGVNPPIAFPESHAGDELKYIMEFEKKSNQYAGRLKEVYDAASASNVEYRHSYPYASPGRANNLASQLELIARLLAGGVKTKIFLCRIGGFDTHGEQVEEYDSSLGTHAGLLYNMSTAVQDWFEGDNEALIQTGFNDWVDTKLPIVATTGIDSYTPGKNPTSLHLYPNPVKELIHIQFNLEFRGAVILHVIDSAGRKVMSVRQEGRFGPNNFTWNVSDLKEGLYHLQMVHQGARIHTQFLKL